MDKKAVDSLSKKVRVTVAGGGYVGLSLAILLTKTAEVTLIDVNAAVLEQVRSDN
jgi:glycine/D-amino acid oxidase-like deaminating enzyme